MSANIARTRVSVSLAVMFLLSLSLAPAYGEHGWPLSPTTSEHPIGNTMGEFQQYSGGNEYFHDGIDILGTPEENADGTSNSAAPWVRATVAGIVSLLNDNGNGSFRYNGVEITGVDGVTYTYWHLRGGTPGSYDVDFVNHFNNGTYVSANDKIAKLVRWIENYDFHHLHYRLQRGADYINPLANITPNPDPDPPEILQIGITQNNSDPWVTFNPIAAGACTVVNGNADIVAQIHDRDDNASTFGAAQLTNWVYNIRWRACPDINTNCAWQLTRAFDTLPSAWAGAEARAAFSNRAPWNSDSSYWTNTQLYGIVTNYVAGVPNAAGNWNTAALADGSYSVSVEATDFAGNVSVRNVRACVQNGPNCVTELTVRDAADDTGAIPYPGQNWNASPDITVNPGASNQNTRILIGAANTIRVRAWNYGSCAIPAGTAYDVCIGWGQPTTAIPHPLPAGQQTECRQQFVPAGGWAVGTRRETNFAWNPAAGTVPEGKYAVVAWVNMPADRVLNAEGVNWDDNRAQRVVTFGTAVCNTGQQRQVTCTTGGRPGIRTDNCVDGDWVQGQCRAAACTNGEDRYEYCYVGQDPGFRRDYCRNGTWVIGRCQRGDIP